MKRIGIFVVLLVSLLGFYTNAGAQTSSPTQLASAAGSPTSLPIQYNSLYASAESNLWQINPANGAATFVGAIGYAGTDIAFVGNNLFGISFSSLLSIDPVTGAGHVIGETGFNDMNALAVAPDGQMYADCIGGAFIRIDKGTAKGTLIGYNGPGFGSSGDIAFRGDGTLFAALNRNGYNHSWLAVIDVSKGTATPLGDIGFEAVYGLSFQNEQLYGVTAGGEVLRIDTQTGRGTVLNRSSASFWGLATSGKALTGSITLPADNSTIGPSSVGIAATATYEGGNGVKEVDFYVQFDHEWWQLAVDKEAPYTAYWETPADLRSQQVLLRIDVVGDDGQRSEYAGGTRRLNFIQSVGTPGLSENWVPSRAYLNQRSLSPDGDEKCNVASMAMVLAMIGLTDQDYQSMADKANEMYPDVLQDGWAYVYKMRNELRDQGAVSEYIQPKDESDAWKSIKKEIDAGRPLIVRPAQGIQTPAGHYIVAVGYQEQNEQRTLIVYDPFGRWLGRPCAELKKGCEGNYDRNFKDPVSRKGQWVMYDFDTLSNPWDMYLITASRPGAGQIAAIPSTPPDNTSVEALDIASYEGIPVEGAGRIYLPLVLKDFTVQYVDPDDGRLIYSGQELLGTINPATDEDTYYFDANAGTLASIRMVRNGGSVDSFLGLYTLGGALLAQDDNGGGNSNALISRYPLPLTGRYKVVASSYYHASAGPYALRLDLENAATPTITPSPTPTNTPVPSGRSLDGLHFVSPPAIDGDIWEWASLQAQALDSTVAEGRSGPQPYPGAADASLGIRSGWDQGNLYFQVTVHDDVLIGNESANLWEDDAVEIGLQGNGHVWQLSFGLDGRRTKLQDSSSQTVMYTIAATRRTADGWQIEIAVPAAELGMSQFTGGTAYPFTFGYWDDDDGGAGDSHLIRWGTSTNSKPYEWGSLQLSWSTVSPAAATPTPVPPVQSSLAARRFILPPVVDAALGDWSSVPPILLNDARAETHSGSQPHPSEADLSLTLHAGWDPAHLYFGIAVRDDQVIGDSAHMWDDDEIELGIQIGGHVRQFLLAADGRVSEVIDASQQVSPALTTAFTRTATGWTVEAAIPASELGVAGLSNAASYPFTVGYWDDDDGGAGETHLILWGTSTNSGPQNWRSLWLDSTLAQ